MFNFENVALILTGLVNIILFIVTSLRLKKSKNTVFFLLFNAAVFGWVASVTVFKMLSIEDVEYFHIPQFIYTFAAIIPASLIFFIDTFPNKKLKMTGLKKVFLVIIPVAVISLTLIPNLVVKDVQELKAGIKSIEFGIFYSTYVIYIISYFVIGLIEMIQEYRIFTGIAKKRIQVIFFSILVSSAMGMFANLILPTFGNFDLFWLGPVFSLYMVITVGYGIVKYGLFETKIITTEFATFLMWGVMIIRFFYSESFEERIINFSLFFIIFLVGIYIIKSAVKENVLRENIAKANTVLEQKNNELIRISAEKTEFVSLASHQIRGPLTSIKGYSSLLLEGDLGTITNEAKDALRIMIKSCDTLAGVVNDYLDVSRIEQGKMRYEFGEVNAHDLVLECVNELTPSIKNRGLTCSLEMPEENTPVEAYSVRADKAKLKQVIMNLIDNALKYTPKGKITVRLIVKDIHKVRIEVIDTGVGIAPDVMPKLFAKFSRAPDATESNILGTGLGLYIAKAMIEAHEGHIWAESDGVGKGSRFIVELVRA